MPNKNNKEIKCSFCGKSEEQVKNIIAGPNVYICNECVGSCVEILKEENLRETIKKVLKELE